MSEERSYPALSEDMQARGLGAMLRIFGPGAIIASVTIGSGETVFASRGGAVFGYALLWCFIGGGLMKFVQVYTAARYMTLTGEHPLERWKFLPGPQGWVVWVMAVLTVLCFPLWLSGLPKMLGGLVVWILGCEGLEIWGDSRVWGTAFVALAIAITMVQSYGALEKFQTVVVGVLLLSILTAAAAAQPDWLAVLIGSIVPTMPAYDPWLISKYPAVAARSAWVELGTYLGAIGGGTQDYFGYIGMLREKAWGLLGRKVEAGEEGVAIAADDDNIARGRALVAGSIGGLRGVFYLRGDFYHGLCGARRGRAPPPTYCAGGDAATVSAGRFPHAPASSLGLSVPIRRVHCVFWHYHGRVRALYAHHSRVLAAHRPAGARGPRGPVSAVGGGVLRYWRRRHYVDGRQPGGDRDASGDLRRGSYLRSVVLADGVDRPSLPAGTIAHGVAVASAQFG